MSTIILKMLKVAYVKEKDEPLVPQTWLGSPCVSRTLEASSKPEWLHLDFPPISEQGLPGSSQPEIGCIGYTALNKCIFASKMVILLQLILVAAPI